MKPTAHGGPRSGAGRPRKEQKRVKNGASRSKKIQRSVLHGG